MVTAGLLVSSLLVDVGTSRAGSISGTYDLGINVVIDPEYGTLQQDLTAARSEFAYIASLNANTVALNFYFYVASNTASTVESGADTPSVAYLADLVDLAHQAGLRVQLRPLMNQEDLSPVGSWRGGIKPASLSSWFSSYLSFLEPYMVMARIHHVEEFSVGEELTSVQADDQYWVPIVRAARQLTGAQVLYETNWNGQASIPGTDFGLDFYEPVKGISSLSDATVPKFTAAMEANLRGSAYGALQADPTQTVLEEVGIVAVNGAWVHPSTITASAPDSSLVRSVQTNWFAAACDAAKALGMKGIFYWYIPMDSSFSSTFSADTAEDPTLWQNTAASTAISDCFSSAW